MFYQVLKANVASQNHVLEKILPLRFTAVQQTSLVHKYALRGKCKYTFTDDYTNTISAI